MIVVADPHYKRAIYHDHGPSRRACMSNSIPNGTWATRPIPAAEP
jgi:hypothetical protein